MKEQFAELLAVFENAKSNTTIGITGKRRETVIAALELALMVTPPDHVPVVIPISFQRLADLMGTFFDGGDPVSAGWYRAVSKPSPEQSTQLDRNEAWYAQPAFWSRPDFMVRVLVDKPTRDHPGEKYIRIGDVERALVLLATAKDGAYAHHFADILNDNIDAGTADIFMQMVVYGEEVYA